MAAKPKREGAMTPTPAFSRGERVVITTIDQGRGGSARQKRRKSEVETWQATVVQPSPLGHGLWLVKKFARRGQGGTYTVPEHEIRRAL